MGIIQQNSRIQHHTITGAGVVPTVPASEDFTDGTWLTTDLVDREFCINSTDNKTFIRIGSNIIEVSNATGTGYNFADTDLTLTGDRTHDTDGNYLIISSDGAHLAKSWLAIQETRNEVGFENTWDRFEPTLKQTFVDNINRLEHTATETVINTTGGAYDFRVEGDTETNLLFVDASTDRVGIGTNAPIQDLHVKNTVGSRVFVECTIANDTGFKMKNSVNVWQNYVDSSGRFIIGDITNSKSIVVLESGSSANSIKTTSTEVVINDNGADLDFRIESDIDVHGLFFRGSDGHISIGKSTPNARLEILAQGTLSTDVVFKARNSADTANLFTVLGDGQIMANGLPTSSVGLSAGSIWNNSGVLNIV